MQCQKRRFAYYGPKILSSFKILNRVISIFLALYFQRSSMLWNEVLHMYHLYL